MNLRTSKSNEMILKRNQELILIYYIFIDENDISYTQNQTKSCITVSCDKIYQVNVNTK